MAIVAKGVTTVSAAVRIHRLDGASEGVPGVVGVVVAAGAGFVVVLAAARGLAPAQAGLFFAACAVFSILVAISTCDTEAGFARFLMRYEAQGRPDAVRRAVTAGCVPALGAALFLAGTCAAFSDSWGAALGQGEAGRRVILSLCAALPFAVAADLALSVLKAFGRVRATTYVDRVLRPGLQLLAALVVVGQGGAFDRLVAGWAAAYVASAAVAVPMAVAFLRHRLPNGRGGSARLSHEVTRELWSFAAWRGLARVCRVTAQKADVVIVAVVLSSGDAAVYAAATAFVLVAGALTRAVRKVAQPGLTEVLVRGDRRQLRNAHLMVTTWGVVVAWPVCVLAGLAPAGYLAMFGAGYQDVEARLVVVVAALVAMAVAAAGPVDTLLLVSGLRGPCLVSAAATLAVDVVLCLVLLSAMGLSGAAVAAALSAAVGQGLAVRRVRADLGVPFAGLEPAVAALLAVACFGPPAVLWSQAAAGPLVDGLLLLVGSSVYAVVLWRLRRLLYLDTLSITLASRGPWSDAPRASVLPVSPRRRSRAGAGG